ncbi:helix-turn-helix domain-containing protein [Changchengzhania lutea]|uniref:helix-turn-helix domain-containing protein n=1 Tax=Changchengzhania lutea TaxID=2049305 RepID=UPI00115E2581|nr:helix-turn-helix transcriptional regulator [Changchengzhania lutea]
METATKPNHIGRKISRIRELRGMKQETLAEALNISQQAVSKIEQNPEIEDDKLEEIAKLLGVTSEAIKNYSDEAVFNNIQNNYDGSVINAGPTINHHCTFNPLDKLLEANDENKKLYERLLKAEQDKIEYLEKLLKEK